MWQPIETAPKNGASILLYGYWESDLRAMKGEKDIWMARYLYDEWYINGGEYYGSYVRFPTHWAEIPEPPK
jgi:hypothetical protein